MKKENLNLFLPPKSKEKWLERFDYEKAKDKYTILENGKILNFKTIEQECPLYTESHCPCSFFKEFEIQKSYEIFPRLGCYAWITMILRTPHFRVSPWRITWNSQDDENVEEELKLLKEKIEGSIVWINKEEK